MKKTITLIGLCFFLSHMFLSPTEIRKPVGDYIMDDDPYSECIKIGKDNRIYIADKKAYSISILDANGDFIRKFGERGQGPGQFQKWIGVFDIAPNGDIFQADFFNGNRRITQFDPDGKLIRSIKMKTPHQSGALAFFFINDNRYGLALCDGMFIEKYPPLLIMGMNSTLLTMDRDGAILQTFHQEKLRLSFSDNRQETWPNIPLSAFPLFAFNRHSGIIASMSNDSDTIRILNIANGESAAFPSGFAKAPMTQKDIADWIEKEKTENPGYPQLAPYYKKYLEHSPETALFKPHVSRLLFNPKGDLFIAAPHNNPKKNSPRYSVNKIVNRRVVASFETNNIPACITEKRLCFLEYDETADQYWLIITDKKTPFN